MKRNLAIVMALAFGLLTASCGDGGDQKECTEVGAILECTMDDETTVGQQKCLVGNKLGECGAAFCNGQLDRDCTTTCGTAGKEACGPDGRFSGVCAAVEVCNNLDDNCDNNIDEGNPGGGAECDGQCGKGAMACVNGALVCQGGGSPEAELCDGKDNDCDGNPDQGCDDDHDGFCDATMTLVGTPTVCPLGGNDCNDADKNINPGAKEVCNCADDNCNGNTDEDQPTVDCVPKSDWCNVVQIPGCKDCEAQTANDCTQADLTDGAEDEAKYVCDKKDNNCDGSIDEGQPCCVFDADPQKNEVKVCGTNEGECQKGVLNCNEDSTWPGEEECGGPDFIGIADEVCDAKDNDCDGATDDDVLPPTDCKTAGVCTGAIPSCTDGQSACGYEALAEYEKEKESKCDQLDNDCNGIVDDKLGADSYEGATGNEDCSTAFDLGKLDQKQPFAEFLFQTPTTIYKDGTLGDTDWYKLLLAEGTDWWPCDIWFNECYTVDIDLDVPAGVDYGMCVREKDCTLEAGEEDICENSVGPGGQETLGLWWKGKQAINDNKTVFIQFKGVTPADQTCVPYTASFVLTRSCPNKDKCPGEEGYEPPAE
jgi:hypothetical protein